MKLRVYCDKSQSNDSCVLYYGDHHQISKVFLLLLLLGRRLLVYFGHSVLLKERKKLSIDFYGFVVYSIGIISSNCKRTPQEL